MFAGCAGLAAVGTAMGATAGTTTATVVGGMTIMAGAGAIAGNGTLANHSNTKWNDHNVALTTINADSIYMDAKRDVIGEGVLFFANNGGAITAGQDVSIESEKVTKYIKEKGWTVTGNVSLGGMLTNTDTINAAVRGGDVVGAMAGSNPTFGAIYGLSKMDSPTDFTPLINGGIRATSIANAYGQDLAIQQGAPLLGNNFENTKNALSGGPSVSIGFGTHKSETTWTESYISQFNMGQGSMLIKSGRDINLVGTQIQAEGITLDAGQKLNILADADYYKNRSSGAGVSVSYGASGWGFGVSGNHSKTDSTTYTNAGLNAGGGNLVLKSGAEMNIIGANLDGKFIDVDAKGLLTVASVQNQSHSKNSSFGVNVNQSNAASMNGSRGSSDRTFTDNLTTILGTEGVRIHSDTGTVVEGALIANATRNQDGTLTDHGNLTIETPMLVWKDLEDIDVSKQIGGGINVSGDDGRSTSGTKTFSDVWDDTANADYRKDETIGVTKATIGNGTITITNPSQQTQDIATLNRDINNVQVITKESETHISVTVPVPDSIANPIGSAGGAVANGIVDAASAMHAAVTSAVTKLAEANVITPAEQVEILEKAKGCGVGGSASIADWLISSAYADVAYDCQFTVKGKDITVKQNPDGTLAVEIHNGLGSDVLANEQFQAGTAVGACLNDTNCVKAQFKDIGAIAEGIFIEGPEHMMGMAEGYANGPVYIDESGYALYQNSKDGSYFTQGDFSLAGFTTVTGMAAGGVGGTVISRGAKVDGIIAGAGENGGYLGKSGYELNNTTYQTVRNSATEINGVSYSGHALDQMQNRGVVPSVVENTIKNGTEFSTRPGTVGKYDPVNKIRVIVSSDTGKVVTVIRGRP